MNTAPKKVAAWGGLVLSGLAVAGAVVLLALGQEVPSELWYVALAGGGLAVPSGY